MNESNYQYNEIKSLGFIEISNDEFNQIRNLVYRYIGIKLTDDKRTLLTGRLQKILRQKKFTSFKQYYDYVISDPTGETISELANYISTNHTFFWREPDHFTYFQDFVLPEILNNPETQKSKDLRVWCAASSTGEEPYTLVMLMMETLGENYSKWKAGVLATDISIKALTIAQKGIYSEEKIESLPEKLRRKYIVKNWNGDWEISDIVKREVLFRKFNLITPFFNFKKPFDVVFCRNVMIYFDDETRISLVNKIADNMVHQGYLFIGHSETIQRGVSPYSFIKPAVYKRV